MSYTEGCRISKLLKPLKIDNDIDILKTDMVHHDNYYEPIWKCEFFNFQPPLNVHIHATHYLLLGLCFLSLILLLFVLSQANLYSPPIISHGNILVTHLYILTNISGLLGDICMIVHGSVIIIYNDKRQFHIASH